MRLVFVGRVVPNKCQHDVILALAALQQTGTPAVLDLIGSAGGNRLYLDRCRRLAEAAGVADSVTFRGSITDAELHEALDSADVFVCLSEHEGYCVPLIEAMDHDLPIVAFSAGAVPETLGAAGLLLDEKAPSLVAEALREVTTNPVLVAGMARGREAQLEHHSSRAVMDRMRDFATEFASC